MTSCANCGKEIPNRKKYCSDKCKRSAAQSRSREDCKVCGKTLKPSQKTYCSRQCQRQGEQLDAANNAHPCPICGNITPNEKKYCSRDCAAKALMGEDNCKGKGISKRCVICGTEMLDVRDTKLYCSQECRKAASKAKRQLNCIICGKKLDPHKQSQFCSVECFRKAREQKTISKQHECPICGKLILNDNKYCSIQCQMEAKKRKAEAEKVVRYCEICGKPIESGHNRRFCSNKCNGVYTSTLHKQGRYKEQVRAMQDKGMNDPRMQCSPENYHAKEWTLLSPEGKIYKFKNLSYWVNENANLFDTKNPHNIKSGIYAVKASILGTAKTKCYTYKGWSVLSWGS